MAATVRGWTSPTAVKRGSPGSSEARCSGVATTWEAQLKGQEAIRTRWAHGMLARCFSEWVGRLIVAMQGNSGCGSRPMQEDDGHGQWMLRNKVERRWDSLFSCFRRLLSFYFPSLTDSSRSDPSTRGGQSESSLKVAAWPVDAPLTCSRARARLKDGGLSIGLAGSATEFASWRSGSLLAIIVHITHRVSSRAVFGVYVVLQ